VQHLAGVGAGGQQRAVAQHPGVAVGGPLLVVAVDLADGGVDVDRHRRLAGTGAGRPRPAQGDLGDSVELADVAEGERAQERPQRRGGPASGGPARPRSARCAPGRPPRSTSRSMTCSISSRWARVAGSSSPALATAWSSKPTARRSGLWEDGIEKVPSWSGAMDVSATPFSLLRGPFSESGHARPHQHHG
jgi:hypothetical protein